MPLPRYVAPTVAPTLGRADDISAWIVDRSLTRRLYPIPWANLDWGRLLDDASDATAEVPIDEQRLLTGLSTWQHGLGIWRNGEYEWAGPIVGVTRPPGNPTTLKITARDRLTWLGRRQVTQDVAYDAADLGVIFDALVLEGTKRDNLFGLYASSSMVGVAATKSYTAGASNYILPALQELARTSLDFTMFRDTLYSGPTGNLFDGLLLVNEDAFLGQIGVELDGLSQGNSQVTAGAGTGGSGGYQIVATFEEWDDTSGLLEHFETEEAVKDASSALAASTRRWEQFHLPPKIVTFPALAPAFPGTTSDLIPGKKIRLQIDDPMFDLAGDYTLTQVRFRASKSDSGEITETIDVDMQVA